MTAAAVYCGIIAIWLFLVIPGVFGVGHPSSWEVPLWLRNVQMGADIFQKLVTALAIPVGATWAYFRFFNERPYESRLEPTVSGTVAGREDSIYLQVVATAKNIGQTKVSIDPDLTGLIIWKREAGAEDWALHDEMDVFSKRAVLEPGESIGDAVWVEIPQGNLVALRLDCGINEVRGRPWLARSLVNLVAKEHNQDDERIGLPTSQQTDPLTKIWEGVLTWWASRV